MVDREIINEWRTKADDDFEFARINFEEEKPFFAQICFHFHQSAEKYLKLILLLISLSLGESMIWSGWQSIAVAKTQPSTM